MGRTLLFQAYKPQTQKRGLRYPRSWKRESEWKEFVSWSPLRYDVHENYFTPSTRNSSDK